MYKVWYSNNNWRGEEQIDKAHTYAHKKKKAARDEVLHERREKNSQKEAEEQQQHNTGGSDEQGGGNTVPIPQGNNGQQQHNVSTAVTNNGGANLSFAAANGTTQNDGAGKEVHITQARETVQQETGWRMFRRVRKESPLPV